jgi:hypothetical protein
LTGFSPFHRPPKAATHHQPPLTPELNRLIRTLLKGLFTAFFPEG